MSYTMGWIGTVAFQAFDGDRELVFDLAEDASVPPEFNEGDEIEIAVNPDHPANIAMGKNSGYYEIVHMRTKITFSVPHETSRWRFE